MADVTNTPFHTVLVTGGAGFLGSHIVRNLIEDPSGAPSTIVAVGRSAKSAPSFVKVDDKRVQYENVDIADDEAVRALFKKVRPQIVFHAASPKHTSDGATLNRINVTGTGNLLRYSSEQPETKVFVYTSTESATHPTQELQTEANAKLWDNVTYNNSYGLSKANAERLVFGVNNERLRTASLRLPTLYGEGDSNLAPQIMQSIRKKEHKVQVGQNKKLFEFCYIESAAAAHLACAHALLRTSDGVAFKLPVDGEAYFITDGHALPFFDFMRKCYAAAGHPVKLDEVTKVPLRMLQAMASVGEWAYWFGTFNMVKPTMRRMEIDMLDRGANLSIEKARERFGYAPVLKQDAAIEKTMKWAVENITV